ncbi:MAG: cobalamin-binding protein [Anaerofustis stercorihominis]|nr:cobalamin-binding protein [Anaerofustis stercorihominis]
MADFRELSQLLGKLDENGVYKFLKAFVKNGATKQDGINAVIACQEGMAVVGSKYEKGEYYIGDLIYAGDILSEAMDILHDILEESDTPTIGTIVLGTVQGDLHDIGKKIFQKMAEVSGFEVYDLGIDVPAKEFVKKITDIKADIVGLSGVLTMAISEMKYVVEEITRAGLRHKVKIILGGNCVSDEVCDIVRADAATKNAAEGVRICMDWVK